MNDNKDLIISKYKELVEYYELFHQSAIGNIKLPDPRMIGYDVFKANIDKLNSQLSFLQEQEKEPVPILTDLTEDDKKNTIDQFVRMIAQDLQ